MVRLIRFKFLHLVIFLVIKLFVLQFFIDLFYYFLIFKFNVVDSVPIANKNVLKPDTKPLFPELTQ